MVTSVNALGPIFLVVLLGYVLRRLAFPGADFWPLVERFTYYLLFPALLIRNLATASFEGVSVISIAAAVVLMMLISSAFMVLTRKGLAPTAAAFTSVFQGGIRFNTYVGLASVKALLGDQGLVIAAVTIAVMIPLANVLCVLCFAFFGEREGKVNWGKTLQNLIRNPLILGCLIGIALNVTGIHLPFWSAPLLGILGQAALPLGLLAVGVALDLRSFGGAVRPLLSSCLVKFAVMPLTMVALSVLLHLPPVTQQALTLFAALPTAPSAYILARQMGGDAPLMAGIITAQTLLAMLTLPFTLWLMTFL